MSRVDIRECTLQEASLEGLERLAVFLRIDVGTPDRDDPSDVEAYKRALCNQIARRTDSRFFRR